MNPALMNWYLAKNLLGGEPPLMPMNNQGMPMQLDQNQETVPGTMGAVQAPRLPKPQPVMDPNQNPGFADGGSFMPKTSKLRKIAEALIANSRQPTLGDRLEGYEGEAAGPSSYQPSPIPGLMPESIPGANPYAEEDAFAEQYNIPSREETMDMYNDPYDGLSPAITAFGPGQGTEPLEYEDQVTPQVAEAPPEEMPVAENPIAKGAELGAQAARKSYGMDDDQRSQAMGHALMGFFSKFASSENPSTLGALNESFSPAQAAFISERDKRELTNRKEAEMAQNEAYRNAQLDISRGQLEVAKQKAKNGVPISPYQLQNLKNGFIDRASKIEELEQKAIYNASKQFPRASSSKSQAEALEKKTQEIKPKYDKRRERLSKEALSVGIDLYPEMGEEEVTESVVPGGVAETASTDIDLTKIPRLPNDDFDLTGYSPADKKNLTAYLKRKKNG